MCKSCKYFDDLDDGGWANISVARCSQDVVFCRKLANELGFTETKPTVLWEDNDGCLSLELVITEEGESISLWGFSSSLITWQGYSELALCCVQGLIDGPWNEILPMASASANETSNLWWNTVGFGWFLDFVEYCLSVCATGYNLRADWVTSS